MTGSRYAKLTQAGGGFLLSPRTYAVTVGCFFSPPPSCQCKKENEGGRRVSVKRRLVPDRTVRVCTEAPPFLFIRLRRGLETPCMCIRCKPG